MYNNFSNYCAASGRNADVSTIYNRKLRLPYSQHTVMPSTLALAVSILLGVAGQLGLKAGALQGAFKSGWIPHHYIVLGLGLYAMSALFYIFALKNIPLSVAFPSVSISYVAVAYLASLIWKEPFGWQQVAALILICSGISLLFQYRT